MTIQTSFIDLSNTIIDPQAVEDEFNRIGADLDPRVGIMIHGTFPFVAVLVRVEPNRFYDSCYILY